MTKILFIFLVPLFITLPLSVDAQVTIKKALPLISAHRGASRLAPENTVASFVKAIEAGADFIEIDVRTTSDGQQVIVHDKSLKRTTGLNALVSDKDYATITALSAGDWFGKDFSNEKVPTLEQICVLVNAENKRLNRDVKLYVDCKAIDASKVTSLLKKYELIDSAVFYGDDKTLNDIKKHFDRARVMPAFHGTKEADELIRKLKPFALDVPYGKLDKATVAFIHGKGIKVFSDLLGNDDRPESYLKAIEYGIDLIQTDDVDAVRRIYEEFQTHEK
ncbi:MAG TPA: glycerophosphodiester phosphodiesterase family protein [Chryseolinea sp.]|nr:glycerophosphodiester phosphodiesterase family protein [Chryseolinea sp.]